LASAMATSLFNFGTAVGTWITGLALASSLGALAPPVVGLAFTVVVFLPLGILASIERRARLTLTSTREVQLVGLLAAAREGRLAGLDVVGAATWVYTRDRPKANGPRFG
jgi:hypothetical protein